MQQHQNDNRFYVGKLGICLVFAMSVGAGIFSAQIAKTARPENTSKISQVGFNEVEPATSGDTVEVLSEVSSNDIPSMQPIIEARTVPPTLMAQKLNLRPSNSTLRRQTTPSKSFNVAQHLSPSHGSPSDDPFLVDEKTNLTNLIPGEDLLSDLILKATHKGIAVEDVGIEAILNLATVKDQPLTIDAAIRTSKAALATAPAKVSKPDVIVQPKSKTLTLETAKVSPAAPSLAAAKQVAPRRAAPPVTHPTESNLLSLIAKPAPQTLPTQNLPAGMPVTGSLVTPTLPAQAPTTGVKAAIAPSVSSLRTSVDSKPNATAGSDAALNVTPEQPSDSVFSIDELLQEMEKTPVPEFEASVAKSAEQKAAEQKPDPSKYAPENPAATAKATPNTAQEQVPTPVKSQPPIQYSIPPEPHVVITRQMSSLQPKISKTLRFYYDRPLNTQDDSAWSVMHSILGYGQNGMVAINGKKGRRTNAVSWMCSNNPCANRQLLYLDRGYIKGLEGPGFQGHPAQFLAMMAQVDLRRDYPVRVQGYSFKVEDMVNSEMYTCSSTSECTFKLIALSHYLHSDAQWRNEQGEVWNIPRLLEIELSQPVNGAACGGTHRVMSICYAVRTRQRRGEPLDGIYVRAEKYMRDYQRYAMSLQNSDGSFSSDWYKRRSDWGDKNRQLQTTGHLLEWLVYSLPRNELSDPRIVKSVQFLSNLMTRHRYHDWEVGPRGHAIRALALYHKRVFERQPSSVPVARLGSLPAEISIQR